MITFLVKVCTNRRFCGILMEVKKESVVFTSKSSIFCTFNSKQNKQNQLKYSIPWWKWALFVYKLWRKASYEESCFHLPMLLWQKKQVQKGLADKKFFCVVVLTVNLPLAGNCGRKFFALLCLTLPSYHTAVPGAYSTEIEWILPLSENEIKLNFNCSWAVFIMGLQPLQIYSETSKSSENFLARCVFHSHLSLLWNTSGASIANVSLDVEKKSIMILGKMIYVKLAG